MHRLITVMHNHFVILMLFLWVFFWSIPFMNLHQDSRDVTQYHFTKWPDHGTPDPLNLLVFHSKLLNTRTEENEAPIIVHCR